MTAFGRMPWPSEMGLLSYFSYNGSTYVPGPPFTVASTPSATPGTSGSTPCSTPGSTPGSTQNSQPTERVPPSSEGGSSGGLDWLWILALVAGLLVSLTAVTLCWSDACDDGYYDPTDGCWYYYDGYYDADDYWHYYDGYYDADDRWHYYIDSFVGVDGKLIEYTHKVNQVKLAHVYQWEFRKPVRNLVRIEENTYEWGPAKFRWPVKVRYQPIDLDMIQVEKLKWFRWRPYVEPAKTPPPSGTATSTVTSTATTDAGASGDTPPHIEIHLPPLVVDAPDTTTPSTYEGAAGRTQTYEGVATPGAALTYEGAAAGSGGCAVPGTVTRDCAQLRRACEEARAAQATAEARAQQLSTQAAQARQACRSAGAAVAAAQTELDQARHALSDRNSWVENAATGQRVTVEDTHAVNAAAQAAFARYRSGEISAQQLEDEWNSMASPEAIQRLRAQARRNGEARAAAAEAALAEQQRAQAQLCAAADAAETEAAAAQAAADTARQQADAACRAADDCEKGLSGG